MPRISIIVPIFNQNSAILTKCIDSILNQSYSDFELLLIDDGSDEDKISIYTKILDKDERIKLYRQENKGVSSARNLGLRKSNGEFIVFVDSDDWLEKNYLEKMVKCAEKNNVNIVRCTYFLSYNDKEKTRKYKIKEGLYDEVKIREKLIPALISGLENNFIFLYMIKKSKINNIIFNENIGMLEDECFVLEMITNIKNIYLLNEPLYHYYQNEESVTKSPNYYEKNIDYIMLANKEIKKILCDKKIKLAKELNYFHLNIILNYLYKIYLKEPKKSVEMYKHVYNNFKKDIIFSSIKNNGVSCFDKLIIYAFKKNHRKILFKLFFLKKIKNKKDNYNKYAQRYN